jgi:hypothetical protein
LVILISAAVYKTLGKSGKRAPHGSFILCACFFGQSAVISSSQSINLALRPRSSVHPLRDRTIGTLLALRRSLYMPQHENADRARAERIIKAREQQRAEAPKATADYYAAQQRIRDRTQDLRRLRLAREAQEKARAG